MKYLRPSTPSRTDGFTLVELITVLALIGTLAVLSTPALSALSKSGNMNQTVSGISLLLEQARAYAMANNTYVWVGFVPNTANPNLPTLTIGAVAGTTGQQSDLSNAKYLTIFAPQTYGQISLKSGLTVASLTQSGDTGSDISTSTLATFTQTKGGTAMTLGDVLQYDPQGEASLTSSIGTIHGIQIGLQPVRGGDATDPNVAILQVASLTGQVQVFRP